ncbi:hypothetical protein KVR01_007701 [Diaporthe batatas]|uniref:uncharacterized protein n=1 Tax=Diaporthe batatas TaxID=748121 RepID=UPI001D0565C6|nr:uncharacterized protein KVR01_007701 [Diaporthe batatas]KAG8161936.1 hypothetical protein KVR01_007701 [Diaporthe batatas]
MTSTTHLRVLRTSTRPPPSQLLLLQLSSSHHRPHTSRQPFSTSPHARKQPASAAAAAQTHGISPTAANPPASTRPPPLSLPARDPSASTFSHLFATGKAYLTFYKTGFRQIYTNTRLVWSLGTASGIPPSLSPGNTNSTSTSTSNSNTIASPPTLRPAATTRSTELLRRRWRHDVRRLPLFALMFVVCGEFTPLVVLLLPRVVPLTCRIPRQVEQLREAAEARRQASAATMTTMTTTTTTTGKRNNSGAAAAAVTAHVARSLGLVSPLWDRLPLPDSAVALLASRRVRAHAAYLVRDGHLLSQAGGVPALEDDEVVLACEDRGLPVVGRSPADLRKELAQWVDLAGGGWVGGDTGSPWSPEAVARQEALVVSLLAAPEWPPNEQQLGALASMMEES